MAEAASAASGARADSAPTTAPVVAPPAASSSSAGPADDDARALAFTYAAQLQRGSYRTGEFAGFFSRTTTAHKASVVGAPRPVGRSGDAFTIDVDVLVERTLGSGAVDKRTSTVRLVLRGQPGTAVIESAVPGPLQRSR
jgi:hypothetical protein